MANYLIWKNIMKAIFRQLWIRVVIANNIICQKDLKIYYVFNVKPLIEIYLSDFMTIIDQIKLSLCNWYARSTLNIYSIYGETIIFNKLLQLNDNLYRFLNYCIYCNVHRLQPIKIILSKQYFYRIFSKV